MAEELGGEDVVEMANLRPPRPASQPNFSVTVADTPTVVANRLPVRVVRQLSPQVIDWVSRNKDALLDFWYHGDTWTQPEVFRNRSGSEGSPRASRSTTYGNHKIA